jgi:hypothetical protein
MLHVREYIDCESSYGAALHKEASKPSIGKTKRLAK